MIGVKISQLNYVVYWNHVTFLLRKPKLKKIIYDWNAIDLDLSPSTIKNEQFECWINLTTKIYIS